MIRSRRGGDIATQASEFVLFAAAALILLQNPSAAQTNAPRETAARPGITSATLAAGRAQPRKTYHDGSIRDVGAVGHRDIGCSHGLGSQYSLQAQVEMGRSDAQKVETTSKLITDPVITGYVDRIGQNLVRNSDAQVRFSFKIIATGDVNAFSLPGGFIFVDSGLILAAENEAELAAVISHEIAHVAACHAAQEMASEEVNDLASLPLIFRLVARHITRNTAYLPPAGSFESEADLLALEYLYKTGYDPWALPAFFETTVAIQKQRPGSRGKAFEPDAQIADRIKKTQQEIKALLPPTPQYKVDSSDFQEIKLRLAEVEKQPQNALGRPRQIR